MANLHNVTDGMLADMLGQLDANRKGVEEQIAVIKEEIERRGFTAARGERFAVTVSKTTSARLDTDKVKALLGDEIGAYQKTSTSTRINVKVAPQLSEVA